MQRDSRCNCSHSHFFCSSPRVSSFFLSSLFHVIFSLFPPLHTYLFSSLNFLHCNWPPSPCPPHTLFLPLSCRSFSEGGRDTEGRTCSPPKCLAATNACNKISSEDKKAIELVSCYNPLNAGEMEAKFLLSS